MTGATAIAVASSSGRPAVPVPETRLEIGTPGPGDPFSLAISPDGRSVVFQPQDRPLRSGFDRSSRRRPGH